MVDYSDLLALLTVPLAWRIASTLEESPGARNSARLASIPVALVTLLAVTGTSVILPTQSFSISGDVAGSQVPFKEIYEAVGRVAEKYQLVECAGCTPNANDTLFYGEELRVY